MCNAYFYPDVFREQTGFLLVQCHKFHKFFTGIFSKVAYGIVSFREMPDNTTHGPQIIGAYQTYTITVHRGVQNVKL